MLALDEVAEHLITGTADVLPMPVGPQMPDFPPPPETELEKLHTERARLQGLLAEAVADAHRARRERDEMRERVSEPYGCTHCGVTKRGHGRRWTTGVGYHPWTAPSEDQVVERMKARRTVRLAARASVVGRLRAQVEALLVERHSTNEALDDAVQALRAKESTDSSYSPALPWAALMDDEDLSDFLDELADAATANVDAVTRLAEVERACGTWRVIGEAQHGHNTAPGPDAASQSFAERAARESDSGRRVAWRMLAEPEPEFHAWLHHENRLGHDLPETGGDGRG
jgi:hypothetical protein